MGAHAPFCGCAASAATQRAQRPSVHAERGAGGRPAPPSRRTAPYHSLWLLAAATAGPGGAPDSLLCRVQHVLGLLNQRLLRSVQWEGRDSGVLPLAAAALAPCRRHGGAGAQGPHLARRSAGGDDRRSEGPARCACDGDRAEAGGRRDGKSGHVERGGMEWRGRAGFIACLACRAAHSSAVVDSLGAETQGGLGQTAARFSFHRRGRHTVAHTSGPRFRVAGAARVAFESPDLTKMPTDS